MPYIQFSNPVKTINTPTTHRFLEVQPAKKITLGRLFTYNTHLHNNPRAAIHSGVGTVRNVHRIQKNT